MFGRPSLRELFAEMREESKERSLETKALFAEMREDAKRRDEEMREFNREILLRNEKVYTSVIAQLEENTAKVRESTEETRAQTRALMTLIDRMGGTGGAAAA